MDFTRGAKEQQKPEDVTAERRRIYVALVFPECCLLSDCSDRRHVPDSLCQCV